MAGVGRLSDIQTLGVPLCPKVSLFGSTREPCRQPRCDCHSSIAGILLVKDTLVREVGRDVFFLGSVLLCLKRLVSRTCARHAKTLLGQACLALRVALGCRWLGARASAQCRLSQHCLRCYYSRKPVNISIRMAQ